jgi:exosortase/archaeosortase family protein
MMPVPNFSRRAPGAPWLRFSIIFALLLCAYYIVVLVPWFDRLFYDYLAANAWAANGVLHLMGQKTSVSGVTIRSAQFAVAVRRGCDAIEPAWFFSAAVLAFPIRIRKRYAALLGGVTLIVMLNVLRIVSLYFIGLRMPAFFPAAHLELWPAVFVAVVLALWIACVRSTLGSELSKSR